MRSLRRQLHQDHPILPLRYAPEPRRDGLLHARGITIAKLDRAVTAAIREHLYTPENPRTIIRYVRNELAALARQEAKPTDQTKALREVEREIQDIKQTVKLGKATESLLEMSEDAASRRKALIAGQDAPRREDVQVRLERVLVDLPARVQARLQDLETLRRVQQVERGRAILRTFITEIRIHPDGTAEICGDLQRVLSLVSREKFTLVAGAAQLQRRVNDALRVVVALAA